jgi:hypothetical protein
MDSRAITESKHDTRGRFAENVSGSRYRGVTEYDTCCIEKRWFVR